MEKYKLINKIKHPSKLGCFTFGVKKMADVFDVDITIKKY